MNSLIDKNGKYIGQFLYIRDTDFCIRMFTKFYNLATKDSKLSINLNIARDLIYINKMNKIYVNNPYTENNSLKSINIGDYMVFIQDTHKIYLLSKDELKDFMDKNEYKRDKSTIFVLGIDNGIGFKNMHIIIANNLETAKNIYMNRFKESEPICIGIINGENLSIISDKYKFSVPLIM